MEGRRQKSGGGRRRRRKAKTEKRPAVEPVTIAARRPNSPRLIKANGRSVVAASASPLKRSRNDGPDSENGAAPEAASKPQRRAARIVQLSRGDSDAREQERLRLLDRLMDCETRGAITRCADSYTEAGFEFPEEQEIQLQLLEHFDDEHARRAIEALGRVLETEPPLKRPILDQRLKRIEEHADDPSTRDAAAVLRRQIR